MSEPQKPESTRRLTAASSPHVTAQDTPASIMMDVLIALIPALVSGIYFFGPRALTLTLVTVASTVGSEALYRFATRQPMTVGDLSATVTGMLLAMSLPVTAPYWVAVIGGVFAIVVVKQLFGGLGKNFMNPALAGRVFLFSFPAIMGKYVAPGNAFWTPMFGQVDAVSTATPMASLHQGVLPADVTLRQLLAGQHGGCLGEAAAMALILGGLYLLARKVISPRIPLFYLGTVALLTFAFPPAALTAQRLEWTLYNLLSGGLLLAAIFMATDYVTSPVTPAGQRVYAIGCGALTVFLRYFGSYPEGVSFAILVMNTLVWALDKGFMPHRFGTPWLAKKERKEGNK